VYFLPKYSHIVINKYSIEAALFYYHL